MGFDPVELPHRYRRREDIEVVALLSASLAYGRADLFKPKLEQLLAAMGESPADFATAMTPARARKAFAGFVYRFNLAADIGLLVAGMGAMLRTHGTLGAAFRLDLPLQDALTDFVGALRNHPREAIVAVLGPVRGIDHLLPLPSRGGSCKRLLLFLRWMARGPDAVDFGIWKLAPAKLVIPLDTHIARISRLLGLTARNDLSWKTAEEITASLRLLAPDDPVRYDFALCHYGMSGVCPARPIAENCRVCALAGGCRVGKQKRRVLETLSSGR
jgi:uncharacterized protein (TIGR02757 family)